MDTMSDNPPSLPRAREPLTAWVSRRALRDNLAALRRAAGRDVAICAMIKADAYGHGQALVAGELSSAGVDFFAVARLEEAIALRELGVAQPILLLEPVVDPAGDSYFADRLEAMCRVARLHLTIADAASAGSLAEAAERIDAAVPVHVKVDTGMGRGGALPEETEPIARAVEASDNLVLAGLYTHLATADEPDEAFARRQLDLFTHLVERWAEQGRRPRWIHAANSAALVRFGRPWLTLARPGIALYGLHPNPRVRLGCELSPAMRVTARLVFVKDLPAGHSVGYGGTWTTARPSRIALVPIGYGDGYGRAFGNRAVMQVGGRDVPVVGRISMDLTTVDLTDLPGGGQSIRAGREIVVISERPDAANSIENLAALAGTIPYEVVTQLGPRIRRALADDFPPAP